MDKLRRNPLIRYGFALLAVAAAIGTVLIPRVGMSALGLLFLSVFLSASFGGLGPGLFATGATVASGVAWAFLDPRVRVFPFVIAQLVFTGGGVLICLVVRSMDGARRRAEENALDAARQSERLRTTLSSIGDAVIVADENGDVISLNPVAEALTGWTQAQAQGRRLAEVYQVEGEAGDPTASDSTERIFEAWGMGGITGRSLLVSRDGTRRPIDETAAAIRAADRSVRGAVLVFRDVSERRDAERRLSAAEARFRAFMDHSPVVAYIKDEHGRYVWGNTAWGRLHRGGVAAALGKTDFDLWPVDTAKRFRQSDRAALKADGPTQVDEPSSGHDGSSSHWISVKFRIGDDTPPLLLGGISVDGTDRVEAERALRDSESRYRTLFDANPLPMWVYDVETLAFLAVNEAAIRSYGYSRDEFLAMRITDIRPADDVAHLIARVAEVREKTYLTETQWRHLTKAGRPLDVEITSHAITFEGRPARLVLAHDVTARRHAEEGLRIHRERLDLVLDAAELGVWYGDIPAGTLALNDRARVHHGIGPDEDVTLDLLTARIHPDDREEIRDCFRRAIAEGDSCDATYRVPGADGRDHWVHAIGRALRDPSGRVTRFDGVTIDVTAQKESEAQLRDATDAAVEANRAKDKFLAVLGHELRTPLTPVLAAVSILLDAPSSSRAEADWPAEQVRETLAMIRRNVELETRLIGDLLDVARVERGQLKLVLERINLHRALREAVDICRDEVLVSGLDVRLTLGAEEHYVDGDHARLLQIAWNLIHNAAKFSPPGGRLTIRTSNVSVPGDRDRIVVEFEDNGAGMTSEVLGRVFDAFEQGDTPARRRIGGLGLGLAISRSIAEAHGGTLSAISPGPGLGSTFRLELDTIPRPAPPEPASRSLEGVAPAKAERSVLLVEDNADTLRYLATLLGQRGYRVATATRLTEAEEAVASSPFDVLISDIELPDGSGLDLMRTLRGKVVGVAVSGFGSDSDVRLSLDAGFSAHLTKPIDFSRLEAAIRDALAVPAS